MNRIHHSWDKWEDYRYNFYGGMGDYPKDDTKALYASLLKDLPRFEAALKRVINEWPYSCQHNLSNESMNRIAYLGQAACALIYNVPSHVSCGGYNLLSDEEKAAADAMAKKYLDLWLEGNKDVGA
jgi:hypothetical protein